MGHNNSWVSPNTSHPRNTSGAEAGANRSALGELSEAQLYRQFTTTVQVVIFIGSLLGDILDPNNIKILLSIEESYSKDKWLA
ncbi:putative G-protein coupled receptor [Cricetulus griseus]|nr:putative G-protein coupled receptor [Cricetulus griseus]